MRIGYLAIKNFRSVQDESISIDRIAALVGANGTGKSTFLRALELFYDSELKVDSEDFYNKDESSEISITITFVDLSDAAKARFKHYLRGDNLVVERIFRSDNGVVNDSYHGNRLSNAAFSPVRSASRAADKRLLYEALLTQDIYKNLPKWKNMADAEMALAHWEDQNVNLCSLNRDDGQFFGFKEVGLGYLGSYTRFLFIPAMRDTADEVSSGRNSIFSQMMNIVVTSSLAQKEEIQKLEEETTRRISEIVNPDELPSARALAGNLTKILKIYIPSAEVKLTWTDGPPIKIAMPTAHPEIVEDGFACKVERCGHGLQRAFLLSMLQHLTFLGKAEANESSESVDDADTGADEELPDFFLAIEEPELYQHPSRQRHFANVLETLSKESLTGVANSVQIMFCTHSPLFISIKDSGNLRLLRKKSNGTGVPKISKAIAIDLDTVAKRLWIASDRSKKEFKGDSLMPRLLPIMTPWISEGFFADAVVLVEGESDRAAILAAAAIREVDIDKLGICVLPVNGKSNLDRPFAIFTELGIPCFLMWDNDRSEKSPDPLPNHRLQRIMGLTDVEDWPTAVTDRYAVFEMNLEQQLIREFGKDEYSKWMRDVCDELDYEKISDGQKNPLVMKRLFEVASENKKSSETLINIIDHVVKLVS